MRYPIDYGYLEATRGGDGEGVDVFVGTSAGAGIVAAAVTVDLQRRDAEVKLLVDCTPDETQTVLLFLTGVLGVGAHLILRERDAERVASR